MSKFDELVKKRGCLKLVFREDAVVAKAGELSQLVRNIGGLRGRCCGLRVARRRRTERLDSSRMA